MLRIMKTILLVFFISLSNAFQCHPSFTSVSTPHSTSPTIAAPRIASASMTVTTPVVASLTVLHKSNRMEEEDADYEGTIDWDAEWKKVMEKKNQEGENRPGKEFYKSSAEIAAIKATRAAQEQLISVQKKVAESGIEAPDFRSLQGDGKFWVGVLAIISVGLALLAASGQSNTYTNDSFYV